MAPGRNQHLQGARRQPEQQHQKRHGSSSREPDSSPGGISGAMIARRPGHPSWLSRRRIPVRRVWPPNQSTPSGTIPPRAGPPGAPGPPTDPWKQPPMPAVTTSSPSCTSAAGKCNPSGRPAVPRAWRPGLPQRRIPPSAPGGPKPGRPDPIAAALGRMAGDRHSAADQARRRNDRAALRHARRRSPSRRTVCHHPCCRARSPRRISAGGAGASRSPAGRAASGCPLQFTPCASPRADRRFPEGAVLQGQVPNAPNVAEDPRSSRTPPAAPPATD